MSETVLSETAERIARTTEKWDQAEWSKWKAFADRIARRIAGASSVHHKEIIETMAIEGLTAIIPDAVGRFREGRLPGDEESYVAGACRKGMRRVMGREIRKRNLRGTSFDERASTKPTKSQQCDRRPPAGSPPADWREGISKWINALRDAATGMLHRWRCRRKPLGPPDRTVDGVGLYRHDYGDLGELHFDTVTTARIQDNDDWCEAYGQFWFDECLLDDVRTLQKQEIAYQRGVSRATVSRWFADLRGRVVNILPGEFRARKTPPAPAIAFPLDEMLACCRDNMDREIVPLLAEATQLTKIALELHLDPATVSRRINAIEKRMRACKPS